MSILAGQTHTSATGWVPTRIRRTKGASKIWPRLLPFAWKASSAYHDMTCLAREATALPDTLLIAHDMKCDSDS